MRVKFFTPTNFESTDSMYYSNYCISFSIEAAKLNITHSSDEWGAVYFPRHGHNHFLFGTPKTEYDIYFTHEKDSYTHVPLLYNKFPDLC